MAAQRALILIGSPRGKSTSARLAEPLDSRLLAAGWETRQLRVSPTIRNAERWAELVAAYREAHLVILACPLYVDALPGDVTVALERLAEEVGRVEEGRGFVAILNCGFNESHQNDVALAICRHFARATGHAWRGGFAVGGGGMIDAQPLEQLGGRVAKLVRALALGAEALARGEAIPAEAEELARKPMIPTVAYRLLANHAMKSEAKRNGCLAQLDARPYAESR